MWEVQLSHCLFMDFISYSTNENKTLFPLNWIQSSIVRSSLHCEKVQICAQERKPHIHIPSLLWMQFLVKVRGGKQKHRCISHLPLNSRLLWHVDKKHGLDFYSFHYLLLRTAHSHEPEACFTLLVPHNHSKSKRYWSVCVPELSDHIFNLHCWTIIQLNPGCPEPRLNLAWPGPPHIHTCLQLIHSESFIGRFAEKKKMSLAC